MVGKDVGRTEGEQKKIDEKMMGEFWESNMSPMGVVEEERESQLVEKQW